VWAFTAGRTPLGCGSLSPPWTLLQRCGRLSGTALWATAVADGVVARVDVGEVVLDLDVMAMSAPAGGLLFTPGQRGSAFRWRDRESRDPLDILLRGGSSTGTHVHIARKYNGDGCLLRACWLLILKAGWRATQSAYLGSLNANLKG